MATSASEPREWYDGCTIYQIYPRSYQDNDGDGVGDLEGIRRRLDYIAELGVDAIWISPFYPSPMKDFGYDVSDYRGVDPLFGNLDDFKVLLSDAHKLGLKVIIDQVWSHTSDQHSWFVQSRSDTTNPHADWYVWADAKPDGTPPNNWQSVFGGPAWTWDSGRHQYYLHNFLTSQPDLNFHNPDVQEAVLDVARFWFELGVDGFRLDVCNFYFQSPGLENNPVRADDWQGPKPHDWQSHVYCRSQPQNLDFLATLRRLADTYGSRLLLGEIGDDNGIERQIEYTSGGERLHMAYSFDLLTPDGSPQRLRSIIQTWIDVGEGTPVWAIGNHDVPRVATRWTKGNPDPRQLRMFAAVLACLPGPVCIYQGDELGLEQVDISFDQLRDPEGIAMWPRNKGRDGCRTPMVWEATSRNGGFSDAQSTWLPIGSSHIAKAVETQLGDASSLLRHYRNLMAWRRTCEPVRRGHLQLHRTDDEVLAWDVVHEDERLLCFFNFDEAEIGVGVLEKIGAHTLTLFSENAMLCDGGIDLGPYGWAIFRTE